MRSLLEEGGALWSSGLASSLRSTGVPVKDQHSVLLQPARL